MKKNSKEDYGIQLLEYFYSIHYQVNLVLEDAMRGPLSRREAALLWLLYAEGDADASMPRKLVADKLKDWFDANSSNVTKIIARLQSAELGLVKLVNEQGSARDKRVVLTLQGRDFVQGMLRTGANHPIMANMSVDEIRRGIDFFREAHASSLTILPLKRTPLDRRAPKGKR